MLLTSLTSWRKQVARTRCTRRSALSARVRPTFERLEDRCVPSFVVTNLSGNPAAPGSLPYELGLANAAPSPCTITFAPGLTGTINLSASLTLDPTLPISITIDGAGAKIAVNGQNAVQDFVVGAGQTAEIDNLTITGGKGLIGGGIVSSGDLTLKGDTLTGNTATFGGGGISSQGTLTMINDTVTGNSAVSTGAGIYIHATSTATITNSTVANNMLTGVGPLGGGISDNGATLSLINTIVYDPNSGTVVGPDVWGPVSVAQNSLFGSIVAITANFGGNQINTNPLLGPLQDNGGPTPTMALLPGSPAIDAGTSAGAPAVDQRGYIRPAGAGFDIGAFEYQATASVPIFAVGSDAGGPPLVKVYDAKTGQLKFQFLAFDPSFTGGVRVAVGDVEARHVDDVVVAAGPGGPPLVKVIDGTKLNQVQANGEIADSALLASFNAYDPAFRGGVNVALGTFDPDNDLDVITGADAGGGPHVKVIDGAMLNQTQANGEIADSDLLAGFYAYAPTFHGGVRVAAADVNGDGVDDVITGAGPGGGPHVLVISGTKLGQVHTNGQIGDSALLASFYAYDPAFTGGVYVAAGDLNGDGYAEVITGPGAGGGPHVKAIDGTKLVQLHANGEIADAALLDSFMAYSPTFLGGVRVAAGIADGDASPDILTGPGPGGGPHLCAFDSPSLTVLDSFYALDPTFTGGIFVGGGTALG
jgi:predicted outer membrane repeat protein